MFPEALVLHCLDNLDSKLEAMRAILGNDASIEGNWTSYNQMFGRPLFKGFKQNGQENQPREGRDFKDPAKS
jgi:3'-5' exoribonuclease